MMITASDFSGGIKAIPSDTINIPGPESKYNGVSTTVTSNKLTDSGGAFLQVVNSSGKITNQAYKKSKEQINILFKNGKVKNIIKASDQLNLKALSKPITKYYICYPKNKL